MTSFFERCVQTLHSVFPASFKEAGGLPAAGPEDLAHYEALLVRYEQFHGGDRTIPFFVPPADVLRATRSVLKAAAAKGPVVRGYGVVLRDGANKAFEATTSVADEATTNTYNSLRRLLCGVDECPNEVLEPWMRDAANANTAVDWTGELLRTIATKRRIVEQGLEVLEAKYYWRPYHYVFNVFAEGKNQVARAIGAVKNLTLSACSTTRQTVDGAKLAAFDLQENFRYYFGRYSDYLVLTGERVKFWLRCLAFLAVVLGGVALYLNSRPKHEGTEHGNFFRSYEERVTMHERPTYQQVVKRVFFAFLGGMQRNFRLRVENYADRALGLRSRATSQRRRERLFHLQQDREFFAVFMEVCITEIEHFEAEEERKIAAATEAKPYVRRSHPYEDFANGDADDAIAHWTLNSFYLLVEDVEEQLGSCDAVQEDEILSRIRRWSEVRSKSDDRLRLGIIDAARRVLEQFPPETRHLN